MPNEDRLSNSIQTLPAGQVAKEEATDLSGLYPNSRVISAISPVVVRRDDPDGPKYQEAAGYTFLVNSPKFPGLVRMDNGNLVLTLSAALKPGSAVEQEKREGVILFSKDEGVSWSQPLRIPIQRCTPVNLGGENLMLRGYMGGGNDDADPHALLFSNDGGQTWSEPELIPPLPDGRQYWTDACLNPLVEGETVTFMFFARGHGDWSGGTLMRPYNVKSHKWGEPFFFPDTWHSSEGSLARAKNGNLVAAIRTAQPNMPTLSDHWHGLFTSWSADNGKTWSEPAMHFLYGHVHQSLLNLPDGRILMTYAARIGELEGKTYHGVESVVSHDNGVTWDWERRYILFRCPDESMHSPQSVCLPDGRIFTVLMHHTSFTWTDGERNTASNLMSIGYVSVVIWCV